MVESALGKVAEAEARSAGEGVVGLYEELTWLLTNGQGQENERYVGLVICERLVNMPVQVVPLMYRD